MVVVNKTNLSKLDMLMGFVNNIVYMVSNPEEHLSPNCNGSSVLELGYYRDDNDSLHFSTSEFGEDKAEFRMTLDEIESQFKQRLRIDSTEEWKRLRK